jgi:replicative DNA helicase
MERAVLGCVIMDGGALSECLAAGLSVIHFLNPVNKRIYGAMVSLYKSGLGIDILSLTGQLKSDGNIEEVGEYVLHQLDVDLPDPSNIEAYITAIKEDALRNSVHRAGLRMSKTANDPGRSTADILQVMSSSMRQAASMADTGKQLVRLGDGVDALVEKLEDGLAQGIQSGFTGLDTMIIGFMDGAFYVIAGRPGMGKTALGLNISKYAAAKQGKTVVIISLEMTQEELSMRYLSDETSIPSTKIRLGMLDEDDWKNIASARNRIATLPIRIEDSGVATIDSLSTKLRKITLAGHVDMVVVDYMQLMSGGGNANSNRENDVSEISRGLKMLAKELQIPIIAMSQLNRKLESRPDKRPQLADIRESGSIEQDADAVMFVYRPEYYRQMANPGGPAHLEETAELILAKNRNGPTGLARLVWDATRMRFLNPTLVLSPSSQAASAASPPPPASSPSLSVSEASPGSQQNSTTSPSAAPPCPPDSSTDAPAPESTSPRACSESPAETSPPPDPKDLIPF